jgi:hypothetical protein
MIDCNCVILSMHFRYILLLFVICFHLFTANGKNNATITLHLNNLPKGHQQFNLYFYGR